MKNQDYNNIDYTITRTFLFKENLNFDFNKFEPYI